MENKHCYSKNGNTLTFTQDFKKTDKLSPGIYEGNVHATPDGRIFQFEKVQNKNDIIVNIPSVEFKDIINQFDTFLLPETKDKYNELGFLYKRSCLLHGPPGTGKTCLLNRVTAEVVNKGGIVLLNPQPDHLPMLFKTIDATNPENLVLVIFEELDEEIEYHETDLTNILDGQIQRNNTLYLATTNFIEEIPKRLLRPGRFSSVIEMKTPNAECRTFYLNSKFPNLSSNKVANIVEKTDGLTIDDLKEVVLSTFCLNINLDDVIARIKETGELGCEKNK